MPKRKRSFGNEDINFSYTAGQAGGDGVLFNVKDISKDHGTFPDIRITYGIKEFLLTGNLKETDEIYQQRVANISGLAAMRLKTSKDKWFVSMYIIIANNKKTVWACADTTSRPAIHLMFPDEY